MTRVIKIVALGSLLTASTLYSASIIACKGCHGANFESKAMGVSKVVKDMSKEDIIKALKGYKDGSYGGSMKAIMKGQVRTLSEEDINSIANSIKGVSTKESAKLAVKEEVEATQAVAKVLDINAKVVDKARLEKEDLGNKKVVDETVLGLRKNTLFKEDSVKPNDAKFDRPAPGAAPKFERAYVNAPPMIPHSTEGLLPITKNDNKCLGCHMPDVAKSMGATPIPPSHFTNYRPTTVYKNGELVKEGKKVGRDGDIGNVGDIKLAKVKKLNHLYQGRFNCSQCHAPQADVDTAVGNTFKPDGLTGKFKTHSDLVDMMNDGVK